ncbi:MAG: hypothetical protein K6C12_06625 [Oscillospiraceae bacterium]|nr:hypothetical protein [Oscillospiraceae bacterium]
MKKRILLPICLILVLLLLTGCASKQLSIAKTAYENGDWQAVVDALEVVKKPSPEMQMLMEKARIHLAFDTEDYEKAIELIETSELGEDEEIAALLADAKAAVEKAAAEAAKAAFVAEVTEAFEAQDYQKVVDLIGDGQPEDEALVSMLNDSKAAIEQAAAEAAKAAFAAEVTEAFEAQDYQKVVDLIGEEQPEDEALVSMLNDSRAAIEQAAAEAAKAAFAAEVTEAFEAQDYQKVVDLIGDGQPEDEALVSMLNDSKAAIEQAAAEAAKAAFAAEVTEAFEVQDYQKVVDLIGEEQPEDEALVSMLNDSKAAVAEERAAANRANAKEMIMATGDQQYIVMPEESSYLSEYKTRYIMEIPLDSCNRPVKYVSGPCVPVERISQLGTGRQPQPFAYVGTRVTVVAEENDMSCILYRSSENQLRAGWVQTRFLVDEFPGRVVNIGNRQFSDTDTVNGIEITWSKKSWLNSQQNYSVLSETVKNCVGFTLDYQLIKENTPFWCSILGPRTVYINDGTDWIPVGSFDYPEFGTVKVIVNLEQPVDLVAVGTIADCSQPNIFWFRQYVEDFQVVHP